jgi:hypothetical protein
VFSANLVNQMLGMKRPSLRNSSKSVNEALEWKVFLKTLLAKGGGLNRQELTSIMIRFYQKRRGQ